MSSTVYRRTTNKMASINSAHSYAVLAVSNKATSTYPIIDRLM